MKGAGRRILHQILVGSLFAMLGPLGALTPAALPQTYAFNRADFATGASPVSMVTSDFNGDGWLDLATANSGDDTVSVLIGTPDGTFQAHVDYKVGTSPSAIAAGDFDGDGRPDLAVANSGDGTVSILLGNRDGTFHMAGHYGTGSAPASVAAGDFNGDGKLDLVIANSGSNSVSVLIGRGDGSFAAPLDYALGSEPVSVAVGDFNGDDKLDLAVANSADGTVSILLGNGAGNFALASSPATGDLPTCVAVDDFNGDGKRDLAVLDQLDNAVSILAGDGAGNFTLISSPATGTHPGSVAAGDFNGDGKLDLTVTNCGTEVLPCNTQTVSVLLGDGTGHFTLATSPAVGDYLTSVAVGDFNGDGRLDLAVAKAYDNTVSILLQLPPAVALSPTSFSFGAQFVSTSSGSQAVTVSNTGKVPLIITNVAASGDFVQTNTCGGSVAIGASCTISVTFTPTTAGTRTGTITINDNARGSPHQVSLSGMGQDFAIGFSRTTETVIAGQAAFYDLQIEPLGGFDQTVAFSCSGAPQFGNCVVSPASIAPTAGQTPVSVSVKVTTRASSGIFGLGAAGHRLPPLRVAAGPWLWLLALSAAIFVLAARRRRLALATSLILLSVMMWVACGSETALFITSMPGTPTGTFTITVTATSGNLTHSATTILVVR